MTHRLFSSALALASILSLAEPLADEGMIELHAVDDAGIGESIGSVSVADSEKGLVMAFDLKTMQPGPHRLNIHATPNCGPGEIEGKTRAAGAAGPRCESGGDPELNDFAVIYIQVDEDGALPYRRSMIAPGLTVADLNDRALVLHGHRDNYRYEDKVTDARSPHVACSPSSFSRSDGNV